MNIPHWAIITAAAVGIIVVLCAVVFLVFITVTAIIRRVRTRKNRTNEILKELIKEQQRIGKSLQTVNANVAEVYKSVEELRADFEQAVGIAPNDGGSDDVYTDQEENEIAE